MASAMDQVMDAIDIETYLVCDSAQHGRALAQALGRELMLGEVDVMYEEFDGYGVRVRLRKYVYRPGNDYGWLGAGDEAAAR